MTENEKASTFIGWVPNVKCLAGPHIAGGTYCHLHTLKYPHDIPAPDMSLPANYMKAVEAVSSAKHWHFEIGLDDDGWFVHLLDDAHAGFGHDDQGSIGMAMVKAFATLYDAEHPKEQS